MAANQSPHAYPGVVVSGRATMHDPRRHDSSVVSSRLSPSTAPGNGEPRTTIKRVSVVPPPRQIPFVLPRADIIASEPSAYSHSSSDDQVAVCVSDRVLKRLRTLSEIHARIDENCQFLATLAAVLPFSRGIRPDILRSIPSPDAFHRPKDLAVSRPDIGGPLESLTIAGLENAPEIASSDPSQDLNPRGAVPTGYDLFDWDPENPNAPLQGHSEGYIDIVNLYLRQAGRAPLLAADEEVELARRIEIGVLAEERLRAGLDTHKMQTDLHVLVERGRRARDRLIVANLRLVVSIAKRYRADGLDFLDVVQFGNEGLMRAVSKFDCCHGTKFSTYATWWIRQSITRGIADTARLVRIPVHVIEDLNKVQSCFRSAEIELGRRPSFVEIADRTGWTVTDVLRILACSSVPTSLDNMIGEDESTELGAFVGTCDLELAEFESGMCRKQLLGRLFACLSDKEAEIIRLRFGFNDGEPRTLEEIGRVFGVTRERIRQLESKAMDKFREHLEELRDIRRDLL